MPPATARGRTQRTDPPGRRAPRATAVFAAEGTAKLTRTPGFAAVTAGPGVTNALSGLTSAWFNSVPMVVMGGRSPTSAGDRVLQEMDHLPIVSPVTKYAQTAHDPAQIGAMTAAAFQAATTAHRGPAFLDVPMDIFYGPVDAPDPVRHTDVDRSPDPDAVTRVAGMLASAQRPVLILGSDVRERLRRAGRRATRPDLASAGDPQRHGPRCDPQRPPTAGDPSTLTSPEERRSGRGRRHPLDFRLGYGKFGPTDAPAEVVHVVDHPDQVSHHASPTASVAGDLSTTLDAITRGLGVPTHQHLARSEWLSGLQEAVHAAIVGDGDVLNSTSRSDPPSAHLRGVEPATGRRHRGDRRRRRLREFRRQVRGAQASRTLARPRTLRMSGHRARLRDGLGRGQTSSQTVLLMGDGAAGFSLMDVGHVGPAEPAGGHGRRQQQRVGAGEAPMRLLHQYDVAADLQQGLRYDDVVKALGGAGETVSDPKRSAPLWIARSPPVCPIW